MKLPVHPVSEIASCFYHGAIAAFLFIGLLFHAAAAAYATYLYRMADAKLVWILATLAFYHGLLVGFLFIGVAFHTYAALAHWRDRGEGQPRDYTEG